MKTMVKLAAIVAAFFVCLGNASGAQAPEKDKSGHQLVALWKEYYAAKDADRPQTQLAVLTKIKAQAKEKSLAWDFWDAARTYTDVAISRNWKLRDSVNTALRTEAMAFPDAIVPFSYLLNYKSDEEAFNYAVKNAGHLKDHNNKEFYKDDYRVKDCLSECLPDYIKDDYEYSLWTVFLGNNSKIRNEARKSLEGMISEYPCLPYFRYLTATRLISGSDKWEEAMNSAAGLCEGKAVSLYPKAALLFDRLQELQKNKNATPQQFKELREEAARLNVTRVTYVGKEKKLVSKLTTFKEIFEELDSKAIILFSYPDKATILVRNLKSVTLTIEEPKKNGKVLYKQELTNTANRYYVYDTLTVKLPDLGDGSFLVKASNLAVKYPGENTLSRYSYAMAYRKADAGFGFFATNAKTGMPLKEVEFVLSEDDKVVRTANVKTIDGFTPIPESIAAEYKPGKHEVYVRGKDAAGLMRRSPDLYYYEYNHGNEDVYNGGIYLNTATFRFGDVIKCKIIAFKCLKDGSYELLKEGEELDVTISDPSWEELVDTTVTITNLGSAAVELRLPDDAKSGRYTVRADYNKYVVANEYFYYGDYVLPSYECKFEEQKKAVFPGDTVHVKGTLQSYSGHKLSDAKVSYTIMSYGDVLGKGELAPDADGVFDIQFVAQSRYHGITVHVTDATGETLEFKTSLNVDGTRLIRAELLNVDKNIYAGESVAFTGESAFFDVKITSNGLPVEAAKYKFTLSAVGTDGKKVLSAGESVTGEPLEVDMFAVPDGEYELRVEDTKQDRYNHLANISVSFVKYSGGKDAPEGVKYIFCKGEEKIKRGEDIVFRLGGGKHPIWAAAELYGAQKKLLWSGLVFVPKGSVKDFRIAYPDSFGDDVSLNMVFFNDYSVKRLSADYYHEIEDVSLPLEVVRLSEESRPGADVIVELNTRPGAEAVASVWDKATDAIFRNRWDRFYRQAVKAESASVRTAVEEPNTFYYRDIPVLEDSVYELASEAVVAYGVSNKRVDVNASEGIEGRVSGLIRDLEPITAREDFSEALYFEPFLKADAEGKIRFTFKASDKLSTYYVAVFAHDKDVRNSLIKKELKVTLPVKVDVLKPEYLVCGDEFTLAATVSSMVEDNIPGKLTVYTFDNPDYSNSKPLSSRVVDAIVPAGGVFSKDFEIPVPDAKAENAQLYILVSFKAENGTSDAMFFKVPMLERAQTITEAHSAVLLSGMDKEALLNELRGRFTGTTHFGAEYAEISILDMVREALQQKLQDPGKDVLSLTEALYVRTVLAGMPGQAGHDAAGPDAAGPDAAGHDVAGHDVTGHDAVIAGNDRQSLLKDILALQNPDGGFAWFKEFSSSPVLTAVVLERFKKMAGQDGPSLPAEACNLAVKYLDTEHFEGDKPLWWGGLSDAQYMYIRALYAEVPFTAPKTATKRFDDFKKVAKEYLTPDKARGLNGYIMAKARRLNTLRLLLASEEGLALAKAWGIKKSAKIEESMKADVASLLEYAVKHRDGGIYYPNAVMPWRGLLETEAYAHAQLAALLPEVADGIRLWLMLQKETQHWDVTPDFVDAIACILDGSKEVLETKVLTVSKTYRKPLEEIVAAGNGFTIARSFYKEVVKADGSIINQELSLGDPIKKGEKIVALYKIYNAENRSFVRVRVPREATLRPVDQLSGRMGWWRRFQGYRDVRTSYTDYFFDSMAEESSEIREEFFVTQTGTFACGVPVIESLYAPHYRANDGFKGPMKVKN